MFLTTMLITTVLFWCLCKVVVSYNDTVDDRFAIIHLIENCSDKELSAKLLTRYEKVKFSRHYFKNLFGYIPHYDYGLEEGDF
jgi:hypothetical protein